MNETRPDLVLLDFTLPDIDGRKINVEVELTTEEFDLLVPLMQGPNVTIQREEIDTTLDELLRVARKGSTGERTELGLTALDDHHVIGARVAGRS